MLATVSTAVTRIRGAVDTINPWATDPEDVLGLCPYCGAEVQRQDATTIRTTVNVTPGPALTSGYRCPNAVLARDGCGGSPPPGGYCTDYSGDPSEFVYGRMDDPDE